MKTILMSIQPKWCEKIFNGEKTIEVRKTAPKEVPFKVVVYCTKADSTLAYRMPDKTIRLSDKREYGIKYSNKNIVGSTSCGVAKNINGKVIGEFVVRNIESFSEWQHDYPSLLRHIDLYAGTEGDYAFLNNYLKGKKHGYAWYISDLKIYDEPKELSEFNLTRPPQSWRYIEEEK